MMTKKFNDVLLHLVEPQHITDQDLSQQSAILDIAWFLFMVFKATFNNISVISWRSVLLVEETGVLGENH